MGTSVAEHIDLIPLLQDLQKKLGYLPREALVELSHNTGLSLSHIYGVATFYSQFRLTPRGRQIAKVCHGTACHVAGANEVESKMRQTLHLEEHQETTHDQEFSVEKVACLGCCSLAPVVTVNDQIYGGKEALNIEKELKKKLPNRKQDHE